MSRPFRLELVGAPGSPYTRKMRALLRYRRIPFRFVIQSGEVPVPPVPVALIPILVHRRAPEGEDTAMIDSTFQLRRLEDEFEGRSVIPPDPGVAFLDRLIEDYADEWLTKAMFHYRWAFRADVEKAASILPRWRRVDVPHAKVAPFSKMIAERQIERLRVVGSNETTAPVIEESFVRLLDALDALLTTRPFVLGRRPAACDFALYGQLTQLALFDPTPMQIVVERAPRIYAWVEIVEDLSGLSVDEAGWNARDALPDALRGLLLEVGRVHAPFLLGNAAALEAGAARVECTIGGKPWVQQPFPYQGKCLTWLREAHRELATPDRAFVDGVLEGTGCEALFR